MFLGTPGVGKTHLAV
ncbi:MAG: hypothetical protein ACLSW1_07460 [Lachnospira sp.]